MTNVNLKTIAHTLIALLLTNSTGFALKLNINLKRSVT